MPSDGFSVIIPVKNEKEHIETSLRSIYNQSYRPLEVIIIDGASTDGTLKILEEIRIELEDQDFRVKILNESDYGPSRSIPNARNVGILNSSYHCLLFLDADVVPIHRDAISQIKKRLAISPWVSVKVKPLIDTHVEKALIAEVLAWYRGIYPQVYHAVRQEIFKEGMFDPDLGLYDDKDFFSDNLLKKGFRPSILEGELLGEHKPHTLTEFFAQQVWYARTIWLYLLKYYPFTSSYLWKSVLEPISPLILLSMAVMAMLIGLPLLCFAIIAFLTYRRMELWVRLPREYRAPHLFPVLLLLDYLIKPVAWIIGDIEYLGAILRPPIQNSRRI